MSQPANRRGDQRAEGVSLHADGGGGVTDPSQLLYERARSGELSAPLDDTSRAQWPHLWSFFCQQWWKPDVPRTPGTLTVTLADGAFAVTLVQRQLARSASLNVNGLAEVWGAADALLANPSAIWRRFGKERLPSEPTGRRK